jgi:hypothetical protein
LAAWRLVIFEQGPDFGFVKKARQHEARQDCPSRIITRLAYDLTGLWGCAVAPRKCGAFVYFNAKKGSAMWIFTPRGFFAITENKQDSSLLHIRSRVKGDIEKHFPDAKVQYTWWRRVDFTTATTYIAMPSATAITSRAGGRSLAMALRT